MIHYYKNSLVKFEKNNQIKQFEYIVFNDNL